MNCVFSPRHMRVIVVVGAEGAVVKIQTLGASCKGIPTSEVFLISKEHVAKMLAVFLAYKAVIQDGGFASGWNGVGMIQNCPFTSWKILNCHGKMSTAMVVILCNSKKFSADIIANSKITMWNIQNENFIDGELLWAILNLLGYQWGEWIAYWQSKHVFEDSNRNTGYPQRKLGDVV